MASLIARGGMIVHEAEKVVVVGAHIVFMYWTKSRVLQHTV
jgi:hypothetical protein